MTAIKNEELAEAQKYLTSLERAPQPGNWQHAALSLAMDASPDMQLPLVSMLLKSRVRPVDTDDADFIRTAIRKNCPESVVKALLDAGFLPLQDGCYVIFGHVGKRAISPELFSARHFSLASQTDLERAYALDLLLGGQAAWRNTLREAFKQNADKERVTRHFYDSMLSLYRQEKFVSLPDIATIEESGLVDIEDISATLQAFADSTPVEWPRNLSGLFNAWVDGRRLEVSTSDISQRPGMGRRL